MFVDTKLWLISNFLFHGKCDMNMCKCNYNWFHMTLLHHVAKFVDILDTMLQSSQYHGELGNQIANSET